MVAYSFKARFAGEILANRKRQTIRADRKRHARPGEELQLYQGMRTKSCRLIARATCESVTGIRIEFDEERVRIGGTAGIEARADLDDFARRDGFAGWDDFLKFWAAAHPEAVAAGQFDGVVIIWKDLVT